MLSKDERKRRSIDAAMAYLERIGHQHIMDTGDGDVVASIDPTRDRLILTKVIARTPRWSGIDAPVSARLKERARTIDALVDGVSLIIIADDRAILRHRRSMFEPRDLETVERGAAS